MVLTAAVFGNTLNAVVSYAYLMTNFCNIELGYKILYRQRYIEVYWSLYVACMASFFFQTRNLRRVFESDALMLRSYFLSLYRCISRVVTAQVMKA